MKLGETSLLELPIIGLKKIFPSVKEYYGNATRSPSGFEHVWTGTIVSGWFAVLMMFSKWFGLGVLVGAFLHIVLKEVILDKKKRVNEHEIQTYKVDLIVRISGWVMGLWMPVLMLFK